LLDFIGRGSFGEQKKGRFEEKGPGFV
jgi:hypothetical protein